MSGAQARLKITASLRTRKVFRLMIKLECTLVCSLCTHIPTHTNTTGLCSRRESRNNLCESANCASERSDGAAVASDALATITTAFIGSHHRQCDWRNYIIYHSFDCAASIAFITSNCVPHTPRERRNQPNDRTPHTKAEE